MPVKFDLTGFLRTLFPEAGSSLLSLYAGAAENAGILRSDFYTLRDLLDLSGYAGEEPLHVLLLGLMLALDEGSLCVEATESGLARRLAYLAPDAAPFAGAAADALRTAGYPALIGKDVTDGKPVVVRRRGDRPYLYFQKYLKHELTLHTELRRRLEAPLPTTNLATLHGILDEVLADGSITLNDDQRRAILLALSRNFAIISGGPGTGKTSIVRTLLRCLVRGGFAADRIVLAAPTGRAAQRLTDAVHSGGDATLQTLTAATLHHLLGYHPVRGTFRHHVENPLPADVVIVDEVSMVGLTTMAQLLQATEPSAKLILLGDKDQLPSVEAGAVLANLVPAGGRQGDKETRRQGDKEIDDPGTELTQAVCLPVSLSPRLPVSRSPCLPVSLSSCLVVLEQNYRSQRDILDVAQAVNRQDVAVVDRLRCLTAPSFADLEAQPGCWLLDQAGMSPAQWRHVLMAWLEHHYLTASLASQTYRGLVETCVLPATGNITAEHQAQLDTLFTLLQQARALTLVREGPWGCAGINLFLDQNLRLRLDRSSRGGLFLGAPVLITRNDYARQLFNGDVGITLRSGTGAYRVVFARQGGYLSFPAEALPSHELAFALTVHKSQGSEYGQVLLVLPPDGGRRLLTKEMIYTGMTRAKQLVVLCARKDVLQFAIGRRVERESALLDFDAADGAAR